MNEEEGEEEEDGNQGGSDLYPTMGLGMMMMEGADVVDDEEEDDDDFVPAGGELLADDESIAIYEHQREDQHQLPLQQHDQLVDTSDEASLDALAFHQQQCPPPLGPEDILGHLSDEEGDEEEGSSSF